MKSQFKVGDRALVAPAVTNANNWQTGIVLEVENNPFNGIVISIKTDAGLIYFHQEKYFKKEQ